MPTLSEPRKAKWRTLKHTLLLLVSQNTAHWKTGASPFALQQMNLVYLPSWSVGRSQAVSVQVHYCRSRNMANMNQEDKSVLGRTGMGVEGYEHP